jgi:FAD/FMN-containing dehydrogenase
MELTSGSSPLDSLWTEYGRVFAAWDDHTLARWLAQTLGQLEGRAWRLSHPLVGTYRLAAQVAHSRQIWFKRLATAPAAYTESPCCRAPFLPLLTRDARAEGLICQHCNEILVPFAELSDEFRALLEPWAQQYEPVHAVAHWDDRQRKRAGNYDAAYESAAQQAEKFLAFAGRELAPKFLDIYPAIIWEDQDECLEVRPEDVHL